MIEVDIYTFAWLASKLIPLQLLPNGISVEKAIPTLLDARNALDQIQGQEIARVLPDFSAKVKELIGVIDVIVPLAHGELVDFHIFRRPMVNELPIVVQLTAEVIRYLRDEGKHLYVLCAEEQKCLSPYTLIEKIENCFSARAWSRIDNHAKKEFEESGKCLALERYTASGLHSLRGVECVIRQWITEVTGIAPKRRVWSEYVETLQDNHADPRLVAVINDIRSLERNPLFHTEHWLEIDEAINIFTLSHSATDRLASDLESKRPCPVTAPSP